MSILDQIKLNKPLPYHQDYADLTKRRSFWRRTHEMKTGYLRGIDAYGNDIVPRHSCEDKSDYNIRLQLTKPKNYAGSIINQYNSFLFNSDIRRNGIPEEVLDDADGFGNSWYELMRDVALNAQVAGADILLPDSTAPTEVLTEAQAQQLGVRPVVRRLDIEYMVNWYRVGGALSECIILFDGIARYYNEEIYVDIEVEKNNRNTVVVRGISEPVQHNYEGIPVVVVKPPLWKESQIAPLAELSQIVYNIDSWLMVELQQNTYSRWIMAGNIEVDRDEDGNPKPIVFSQNRLTMIQSSDGSSTPSITVIGGDTAQAGSLRESIRENVAEIYRTAGLSAPDPLATNAPESGVAKMVGHYNTASIVKSIADTLEDAENKVLMLMNVNATVEYPDDFENIIDNAAEEEVTDG